MIDFMVLTCLHGSVCSDLKLWVSSEAAEGGKLHQHRARAGSARGVVTVMIIHTMTQIHLQRKRERERESTQA